MLQQHLPFTVLKPTLSLANLKSSKRRVATAPTVYGIETYPATTYHILFLPFVATAPTVYGIETNIVVHDYFYLIERCDNTYRLRYATQGARQQRSKATMRSAHLKYLNEVKVKRS